MAKWFEPDEEQLVAWREFLEQLPANGVARASAEKFPPWELLRLAPDVGGQRVIPYSYSDDGMLTVAVLGKFNLLWMERKVFGIKPEELEPCELPDPGEPLGVALTEDQQLEHINDMRVKRGLEPFESWDQLKEHTGCAIDGEINDAETSGDA